MSKIEFAAITVLCLSITIGMAGVTEKHNLDTSIDWSDFLSRHDMHWTQMPTKWYETPFLGNGMMGTMVRQIDDHSVRWDVGRGDVQDHRPGGGMYSSCRLPIGYFLLKTAAGWFDPSGGYKNLERRR